MFEISNNPKNTITNKVIFVKNKNILKKPNKFININDIDTLKAYSDRIKQNDVTLIEYNKNNLLQKIIVVNEKDYSKPFEFQNLGGKVHSLNKSGKLNILLDTLSQKNDDFICQIESEETTLFANMYIPRYRNNTLESVAVDHFSGG